MVRELLHADPRKQGANTEQWDGLDEQHQPVPAGSYTWKLLSTQGLKAEYLMTLGTNPKTPWDAWPGNHNGVWAVLQDESGVYFAGNGEGTPPLVKQTLDEKTAWTVPNWLEAWQGGVDLAVSGNNVLMLQGSGRIFPLDRKTGARGNAIDIIWEEKDRSFTPNLASTQILDMDARGETLVASYANHDAVRWLNPADGKVLDQAAVPEPLGVALAPDGKTLVISKDTVVSLSRENKTPAALITGLTAPWRLAVDQTNGDIFVAQGGSSQQVKKYSKDGKLLQTYGAEGGRPVNGLYNPANFRAVCNIAADGKGGFYVCEFGSAPRRTAHFDAEGKLLREWYGGQMYANFACADPSDPSLVWLDSNWGELIQAKVDYLNKTWKVLATYSFAGLGDGLIGSTYHGGGRWYVRRRNNETYLLREAGNQSIALVRVDEKAQKLTYVLNGLQNVDPNYLPPVVLKIREEEKAQAARQFIWADANADGHIQKSEIKFVSYMQVLADYLKSQPPKGATTAANLKAVSPTSLPSWGSPAQDKEIYDLLLWAARGVPYFADPGGPDLPMPADMNYGRTDNRSETFRWGDEQGNHYLERNVGGPTAFGQGFWSPRVGGNRVLKWDKTGKLLWEVGRHAPGSVAKPGEAKYLWRALGLAHGCIAVSDVEDFAAHVWDQDGLWVGRLLENPDLTAAPAIAYSNPVENFAGTLYENPKTGNVIYFAGGVNNSPVYRIRGWDQFERQTGTVTVSPAAAEQLAAVTAAETKRTDVAHLARLGTMTIDGSLADWKDVKPIEIKDGDATVAKVYLGWSRGQPDFTSGIYAAFDITTNKPWKTAATPQLAFQGGASVDLKMGPIDPPRKSAGPWDVRIVAAPVGVTAQSATPEGEKVDGEVAEGVTPIFEFAPFRDGWQDGLSFNWAPREKAPATYETGNGKITFARATQFKISYVPKWVYAFTKAKADGSGYIVEMRAPIGPLHAITVLPLDLYPGERFRLDLGLTLANPQGNHSVLRLNWQSKDSNDMATQDVYTESLLRPQNWGYAVLD